MIKCSIAPDEFALFCPNAQTLSASGQEIPVRVNLPGTSGIVMTFQLCKRPISLNNSRNAITFNDEFFGRPPLDCLLFRKCNPQDKRLQGKAEKVDSEKILNSNLLLKQDGFVYYVLREYKKTC